MDVKIEPIAFQGALETADDLTQLRHWVDAVPERRRQRVVARMIPLGGGQRREQGLDERRAFVAPFKHQLVAEPEDAGNLVPLRLRSRLGIVGRGDGAGGISPRAPFGRLRFKVPSCRGLFPPRFAAPLIHLDEIQQRRITRRVTRISSLATGAAKSNTAGVGPACVKGRMSVGRRLCRFRSVVRHARSIDPCQLAWQVKEFDRLSGVGAASLFQPGDGDGGRFELVRVRPDSTPRTRDPGGPGGGAIRSELVFLQISPIIQIVLSFIFRGVVARRCKGGVHVRWELCNGGGLP